MEQDTPDNDNYLNWHLRNVWLCYANDCVLYELFGPMDSCHAGSDGR